MSGTYTFKPIEAKLCLNACEFSGMDSYVRITLGKKLQTTRVSKTGSKRPTWKDVCTLNASEDDEIAFLELVDNSNPRDRQIIGTCRVHLEDIREEGTLNKWYGLVLWDKLLIAGTIFMEAEFRPSSENLSDNKKQAESKSVNVSDNSKRADGRVDVLERLGLRKKAEFSPKSANISDNSKQAELRPSSGNLSDNKKQAEFIPKSENLSDNSKQAEFSPKSANLSDNSKQAEFSPKSANLSNNSKRADGRVDVLELLGLRKKAEFSPKPANLSDNSKQAEFRPSSVNRSTNDQQTQTEWTGLVKQNDKKSRPEEEEKRDRVYIQERKGLDSTRRKEPPVFRFNPDPPLALDIVKFMFLEVACRTIIGGEGGLIFGYPNR